MAKKRLTQIAKEYDIPFETAQEIAFNHLTEESITGKGKNLWIDEVGQQRFAAPQQIVQHRDAVPRLKQFSGQQ